ncbi:MAG: DUF2752 domain-containing protein [Phycisphaerales bacterium]
MSERRSYSTANMQERQQDTTVKAIRRASARQRKIAAVIVCAIVGAFACLWLLQRVGFDFGTIFPPCGLRMRTGLTCPTCGMTTAVLAFARGRVFTAFYVQPAAGLLCSLLVATAFFAFLIAVFGVYFSFLDRVFARARVVQVVVGLLVILAAGWVVTLTRALAAQT